MPPAATSANMPNLAANGSISQVTALAAAAAAAIPSKRIQGIGNQNAFSEAHALTDSARNVAITYVSAAPRLPQDLMSTIPSAMLRIADGSIVPSSSHVRLVMW